MEAEIRWTRAVRAAAARRQLTYWGRCLALQRPRPRTTHSSPAPIRPANHRPPSSKAPSENESAWSTWARDLKTPASTAASIRAAAAPAAGPRTASTSGRCSRICNTPTAARTDWPNNAPAIPRLRTIIWANRICPKCRCHHRALRVECCLVSTRTHRLTPQTRRPRPSFLAVIRTKALRWWGAPLAPWWTSRPT